MKLRKKVWVVMLACLVGFQPVMEAKYEELTFVVTLGALLFAPGIIMASCLFLQHVGHRGYSAYRIVKHKCGFESPALKAIKVDFMKKIDNLALKDQFDWKDNCYSHFFSSANDASKKIENFIAGQEEYHSKKPLELFGLALRSLYEKEKVLFLGFSDKQLEDKDDRYFFVEDAVKSIEQLRRNEVARFIEVCCVAYPCQYGIAACIKHEYPNIKAKAIFNAFRNASSHSNDHDRPDAKTLITKDLLFACIEQQKLSPLS